MHDLVQWILSDIEAGGDEKARDYAAKIDKYDGNIILTEAEIAAACDMVPQKLKDDIQFAHDNVKRFAMAQKATVHDFEYEVTPGPMRPLSRLIFWSMRRVSTPVKQPMMLQMKAGI